MKILNSFLIICSVTVLIGFCSCQKVIQVHLNDSSSKYVVEGNVTDQPGPYLVKITRSINFDQDNVFPTVSGATVVVTDKTTGQIDTLKEATPGSYQTSIVTGISGHIYQLYVNVSNNVFTAVSTMPAPVSLDSLYIEPSSRMSGSPLLVPVYTDPVEKGNNYHFAVFVNDTETNDVYVRNDDLINGQVITRPLNNPSKKLNTGDIAVVYLECIDSAIYQYYFTLQQSTNQNSASPANPTSNITGGCLGYFSAHTSSMKSIVVP